MPEYTYRRSDGTTFNIRRSIKDEALSVCPETGLSVEIVIGCPDVIDKTPRTLGTYAEQNTKRVGQTKIQEDAAKYELPQKKEDPWYRSGPIKKELVHATPAQKERYIQTGKI